jgi:hypothetical protein
MTPMDDLLRFLALWVSLFVLPLVSLVAIVALIAWILGAIGAI